MKKLKYTLLLLVAALTGLSSCSKEDDLLSSQNISAEPIIKVSTTGYESADPITRATDKKDEFKTTLAENDRIGIYAVKNGRVISKNIPYKYNNQGKWEKASETAVSVVTGDNVSYFAYYPYRQEMDNKMITSIDDIIANFEVAADQSTHDLYTQNDLMTATGSLTQNTKTLSFTLNHALALIVLDLKGQRTPYAGGYAVYSALSSVTKKQIGNVTNPYTDAKGCFRTLVKPGSVTPDISYAAGGKTVTYSTAITATAGKYSKKLIYAGNKTTEQSISRGDYFYADGNISPTYNNDGSNPCIGIVLTTSEQLEASPYNHGLVVALKDATKKFQDGWLPTDNLPQVPSSCNNWFLPSIEQLKLMIWGNTTQSGVDGIFFLEGRMNGVVNSEKFNARSLERIFMSSTLTSTDWMYHQVINIQDGSLTSQWHVASETNGRAILAF